MTFVSTLDNRLSHLFKAIDQTINWYRSMVSRATSKHGQWSQVAGQLKSRLAACGPYRGVAKNDTLAHHLLSAFDNI